MTDKDERGPYKRSAERAGWKWDAGDAELALKPGYINTRLGIHATQWVEPNEDDWKDFCANRGIPVVAREGEITEPVGSVTEQVSEDIAKVAEESQSRGAALNPALGSAVGMSLRDWFAGLALAMCDSKYPADSSAEWCYRVADAMLDARGVEITTEENP